MHIEKITIKNFRCHEELELAFGGGFTVLVGANGSGKTSALKAILAPMHEFAANFTPSFSRPFQESDIRLSSISINGRTRFEKNFPLAIAASGKALGERFLYSLNANSIEKHEVTDDMYSQVSKFKKSPAEVNIFTTFPLLAFYSADRHWKYENTDLLAAATKKESRFDAYQNWKEASIDSSNLYAWIVGKTLERFESLSSGDPSGEMIDELEIVNTALSMTSLGVKGFNYSIRERTILIEWGGTPRSVPIDNLSSGQRALIFLVADIARRMCLLNPHLASKVTTETDGIVLIDEIDLHLHPKWQRDVVRSLKLAFPKVQFVVTTHSPQVISELQPTEILLLQGKNAVHPNFSYGLDSSAILEIVMDASERPFAVTKSLSLLFGYIDKNEIDSAKSKLEELKQVAPGLPEYVRAEALIRRKETVGR